MEATIQYIEKELSGSYPANEVRAFVRIILEEVCGLTSHAVGTLANEHLRPGGWLFFGINETQGDATG